MTSSGGSRRHRMRATLLRALGIDHERPPIDHDTVVLFSLVRAEKAVANVLGKLLHRPLIGIAKAPTTATVTLDAGAPRHGNADNFFGARPVRRSIRKV